MPRMLTRAGVLAAMFAPALAFAAYDDVSLTTDTVLSVAGITLNVSGSSAVIESITVNATNFSVTMPAGASFKVAAPGLQRLSADTNTGLSSDVCNSSQSSLGYTRSSGDSVTVTVTPSATLCSTVSGGGGTSTGGQTTSSSTTSTTSSGSVAVSPSTTTETVTPTTETVTATATPAAASKSGLSASQINAILDVLKSFNADDAVVASVKASLEGGTTTGSVTSTAVAVFKANLTMGSLGSEVKALQQFLNSKGYVIAASGPGSVGNETTKFGALTKAALIKYQKAKGITPAVGYFGSLTRAAVNADQ